jgi:outer membrane protein OmpA-like peptidoglycan-associated protein
VTQPMTAHAQPPYGDPPPRPRVLVPGLVGLLATVFFLLVVLLSVYSSVAGAAERLRNPALKEEPKVAVADHAELAYCTPQFKQVLERVLHSCGLSDNSGRRGCKPTDVRTFAEISDDDFNALFTPLKDRGAVILFKTGKYELDEGARRLIEQRFRDRRGARYFFIVARASKVGNVDKNRALSQQRANSVMFHIKDITQDDPELEKQVGMLWLGAEYAQFSTEYCGWTTSNPEEKCTEQAINQSALVSWVDCRL